MCPYASQATQKYTEQFYLFRLLCSLGHIHFFFNVDLASDLKIYRVHPLKVSVTSHYYWLKSQHPKYSVFCAMTVEGVYSSAQSLMQLSKEILQILQQIIKKYFWKFMNSDVLKIVAAFRGMHVSPAKHSFGKCDRKVWQTDRQTDGQTTDKVIPMCRYASQATQKLRVETSDFS